MLPIVRSTSFLRGAMFRRIGLQTITVVQGRHRRHAGIAVAAGARVAGQGGHRGCTTVTT